MTVDTPSLGLVMIVRNEARTLPRLAASVGDQIDRYTVVDTGSSDDTVEVAEAVFDGIPGEIIRDEWRGFSASRNVALRAAEAHTDWLLLLDADHTLHGQIDRSLLAESIDCAELEERFGAEQLWMIRLIRARHEWEYRGRTHEHLALTSGSARGARLTGVWVEHHGDGGTRPEKFGRDLPLLLEDWKERPDDPRTAFYLGRTLGGLGCFEEAVTWFRRRLTLGAQDEEHFLAHWLLGMSLLELGRDDEGCGVLWDAWGERPWRAEPLVALAVHYRAKQRWTLAWEVSELAYLHCGAQPDGQRDPAPVESLSIDTAATRWRIPYEALIAGSTLHHYARAAELVRYLLTVPELPPEVRADVEANAPRIEQLLTGTAGRRR